MTRGPTAAGGPGDGPSRALRYHLSMSVPPWVDSISAPWMVAPKRSTGNRDRISTPPRLLTRTMLPLLEPFHAGRRTVLIAQAVPPPPPGTLRAEPRK